MNVNLTNNSSKYQPTFGMKIVRNPILKEFSDELKLCNLTPAEIKSYFIGLEKENDRGAVLELLNSREFLDPSDSEFGHKTFSCVISNDLGKREFDITSFYDKTARGLSRVKYDMRHLVSETLYQLNKNRAPKTPTFWDKVLDFLLKE